MARMYNHARGFVHHQQNFIFIYDVQGDIFGSKEEFMGRMSKEHLHFIAGFYFVVLFYYGVVHPYMAIPGRLLDFAPGGILDKVHEELINPQGLLSLCRLKPEMLKKFFLARLLLVRMFHELFGIGLNPRPVRDIAIAANELDARSFGDTVAGLDVLPVMPDVINHILAQFVYIGHPFHLKAHGL